MRWLLVASSLMAGCSADGPVVTADSGAQTCATTACIAGATCTTGNGTRCRCVEDGVWTCGDIPSTPPDGGFEIDTGGHSSGDALIAPDGIGDPYERNIKGCGTIDACMSEDPVDSARAQLQSIMMECNAHCTQLTLLIESDGCASRFSANNEWTSGALNCIAERIANYRWPCTSTLFASTTSCPD